MSLDVIWFIVISFAFVAYLMVIFAIIGDLFRDQDTSGWVKAAWIVALIFVPLFTSLVYLIFRGSSMSERSQRSAEVARKQQEAFIRETADKSTPADEIAQARALLDAGVISQEEYESLKAKALA